MATKLTDRERKYRAEATRAKAELMAMKARASEMSELRSMFVEIRQSIRTLQSEQRKQTDSIDRYGLSIDRIYNCEWKDRQLKEELNAHMWQTQNRLGAVRDFMVKHMAPPRPSIWSRIAALIKKSTQWT